MKLQLMPIFYVSNVENSAWFYEKLGFKPKTQSRYWAELEQGATMLALDLDESRETLTPDSVEICFVAHEKFENLKTQLETADIETRGIVDEAFGRSMTLQDTDGLVIQINEHDLELHS